MLFRSAAPESGDGEDTPVVTLDSLALKSCRLIKVDVEGMETDVLRGARETIRKRRPILFVENNTLERSARTLAAVRALGYRPWWHLALYYNRKNFFGNKENVFAKFKPEANLLCMPDDGDPGIPELIEASGTDDNWERARDRGIAAGNPTFK